MEPIESSETSAYNNTLTPGTYPKEKKLLRKVLLISEKDSILNPYIAKIWDNVSEIYSAPSLIGSESVKCFVTKIFYVLNTK